MKPIFLSILLFVVNIASYGGTHDTLIVPVTADKLQDEVISKDVYSILNGKGSDNLYAHKVKGKGQLIMTHYKSNGWSFYVGFSEKLITGATRNVFHVYCPTDKPLLEDVTFFHVKWMLDFTPNSLSAINKEILSAFGGHIVTYVVKAYIAKNRLVNYLHLNIEDGGKKLQYVFIIKDSALYQCIKS